MGQYLVVSRLPKVMAVYGRPLIGVVTKSVGQRPRSDYSGRREIRSGVLVVSSVELRSPIKASPLNVRSTP